MLLDGSILDDREEHIIGREDVRLNKIEFVFLSRLGQAAMTEKCRMIHDIDNFNAAYDFTMRVCAGTELAIYIRDAQAGKKKLCHIAPADWRSLRDVEAIDAYPVLIVWLIDYVKTFLLTELSDAMREAFTKPAAENGGGDTDTAPSYGETLINTNFGDPLLFLCYEYTAKMHTKPESFRELFEFLRYSETVSVLKEIAMKQARAANG
jgi:hypothetical protein